VCKTVLTQVEFQLTTQHTCEEDQNTMYIGI